MTTEGPIQVAASADDASEKQGGTGFTSAGIEILIVGTGSEVSRGNGGFRFNAVDVPSGATIDDVDFELFAINTFSSLNAFLSANDVDDAADFSTDPDVTTRIASAATLASTLWPRFSIFPAQTFISSSADGLDLNAIIQEVIDRGGWSTGNDLVMLVAGFTGVGRGSASFATRAYDGNTSQAARLTIDYTGGGGGPAVLASRRLLSGTGR